MAAVVSGEVIILTSLHELEIVTAMQLKVFRGEAQPEQAVAAARLVRDDVAAGKLLEVEVDWQVVWRASARLAQNHAAATGCRSLDILHCALAKAVLATRFVSSDKRQIALARAEALPVLAI